MNSMLALLVASVLVGGIVISAEDVDLPLSLDESSIVERELLAVHDEDLPPAYRFQRDYSLLDRLDRTPGKTTVKNLGKYTFITTLIGKNRYKCSCFKGKTRVWAGMCGVTDKSFNYSNCQ